MSVLQLPIGMFTQPLLQTNIFRLLKESLLDSPLFLGSFRTLSTVLRTTLRAACYTSGIECTANDVVTYTREVLNTTATHEND